MEDHAKKILKEMTLEPYFVLLVSFTLSSVIFYSVLVSGGWSNWTLANDSYCFKDNDKWFKEFRRACDNPEPIFGGSCEGNETKLEECKPSKFFISLFCFFFLIMIQLMENGLDGSPMIRIVCLKKGTG